MQKHPLILFSLKWFCNSLHSSMIPSATCSASKPILSQGPILQNKAVARIVSPKARPTGWPSRIHGIVELLPGHLNAASAPGRSKGCSVQTPKCWPFTLAGSKDFPYTYDIYYYRSSPNVQHWVA